MLIRNLALIDAHRATATSLADEVHEVQFDAGLLYLIARHRALAQRALTLGY